MFARIWRGMVCASLSDQYLGYLRERIIPTYHAADGSRNVFILQAVQGGFSVFLLLSFWESRAALEQFLDPQLSSEINLPERELLLAFESTATVYEIISVD